MGGFHAGHVGGQVHNHQAAAVARGVGADGAKLAFAEGVAQAAMLHGGEGMLQGGGQLGSAFALVAQQLVGHAAGGFGADVGQNFEGLGEAGEGVGFFAGHSLGFR